VIAITIRQPWAQLIIDGHKEIENRSWPTKHRGALVIHAGLGRDREALARFGHLLPDPLPAGVALGTVDLVDCQLDGYTDASEHAEPGFFHWLLTDPEPFPEPIPIRGRLGLWPMEVTP
jgi:hypothetical protein